MTGDEEKVNKKGRDPIFMTCLVIFLAATIAVTGAHIDRHYLTQDNTLANDGYTVTVDYVGTYYAFYENPNAVIFDTTYKNLGEDKDVKKGNDYEKSSYSKLTFKLGPDSNYLMEFQNAILGHKVGDTVMVKIKAADAYVSADIQTVVDASQVQKVKSVEKLSAELFEKTYGFKVTGTSSVFKSVYGWDAVASLNSSDNTVSVRYQPVVGSSYHVDTKYGTVNLIVSAADDSFVSFKYEVKDFVRTGGSSGGMDHIQMIKVDFGTSLFYITGIIDANGDGKADSFVYKNVGEKFNEDLFFKIKIDKVVRKSA